MKRGFTLAELLIALVILGVIATFTIPKLLGGQQDSKKKAIFQETLSAMYSVFYSSIESGEIYGDDYILFRNKLNVIKACNPCSAGCSSPSQNRSGEPGVLLANGASICGFNVTWTQGSGAPGENVSVDWNGAAAPNVTAQDAVVFEMYYNSSNPAERAEFRPHTGTDTLFYEVWK